MSDNIYETLKQAKTRYRLKTLLLPNGDDSFEKRLKNMIQKYEKKENDIISKILLQHDQSSYYEFIITTPIEKIKFLSEFFFPEVWGLKNKKSMELTDEQCFWLVLSSKNFIKYFGSEMNQGDALTGRGELGKVLSTLNISNLWDDSKLNKKTKINILDKEGTELVNTIMKDIKDNDKLYNLIIPTDKGMGIQVEGDIDYTLTQQEFNYQKPIQIHYTIETDEVIQDQNEFATLVATGFDNKFRQNVSRERAFKIRIRIDKETRILARFNASNVQNAQTKETYESIYETNRKEAMKQEKSLIKEYTRMTVVVPKGITSETYKNVNGKNFLQWIRARIGLTLSADEISIIEETLRQKQKQKQIEQCDVVLKKLSKEYWNIFKKAVSESLVRLLSEKQLNFPNLNLEISQQNTLDIVKKAEVYFTNHANDIWDESKQLGFEHFCFMFWALQSQIGTIGELIALHQFSVQKVFSNIKSQGQNQQTVNGKNIGFSFQDVITDKGGLNIKHYLSSELNIYNFSIGLQREISLLKYFPEKTVKKLQILDRYSVKGNASQSYLEQNQDEISTILKYYEPELLRMVSTNFDINNENTFNLFYVFSNIVVPCSYILTKLLEREKNPINFSDFTNPENFVKHTTRFSYSGWTFNESF